MPVLSIKVGALEVSYDGEQDYIEHGLTELVRELSALPVASPPLPTASSSQESEATGASPAQFGHTTSQIAALMEIKGGGDLAQAAAAHLVLVKGQDAFTRSEIYEEMKGAGSYVTSSYLKNLTPSISLLIKGKRFTPIAKDKYSLSASVRKEFEAKLSHE